ncbi:hypothetical protein ElyMa_006785600 [Elysia marginata]|uniref:G-protein coupled receptors family 1 profile domain-containing protein n=1 Tax=Elysia marginata TaxID=1093978 RepID=A0AAV4J336_9GAST|nr:hypothetical protein ElyMa_006785600 [Elysia marginata]
MKTKSMRILGIIYIKLDLDLALIISTLGVSNVFLSIITVVVQQLLTRKRDAILRSDVWHSLPAGSQSVSVALRLASPLTAAADHHSPPTTAIIRTAAVSCPDGQYSLAHITLDLASPPLCSLF